MLSKIEKTAFPYGLNAPRMDPSGLPDAWSLSVKAVNTTELSLQRLMRAERLTFLGEFACLIIDYIAHHPDAADLKNWQNGLGLRKAKHYAFKTGLSVPPSILTPMTRTGLVFIDDHSRSSGQSLGGKAQASTRPRRASSMRAHWAASEAWACGCVSQCPRAAGTWTLILQTWCWPKLWKGTGNGND